MIKRFFFVLFCITLNCIITESKESQIACIYNNKSESITIFTFFDYVMTTDAGKYFCSTEKVENPKSLNSFYGGKLLIKDSSDTVLFDLTGSAIDEAFIKESDYYYRLDVN